MTYKFTFLWLVKGQQLAYYDSVHHNVPSQIMKMRLYAKTWIFCHTLQACWDRILSHCVSVEFEIKHWINIIT